MSWNQIHKALTGYEYKKEYTIKELFSLSFKKRKDIMNERNELQVTYLPKPWIWTRVLLVIGILIVVNYFVTREIGVIIFPYLTLLMAAFVPITVLTFLFEINRNEKIAILDLVLIFLFGSSLSLVSVTATFFSTGIAVLDPLIISIVEEFAKIVPIFIALRYFRVKTIGLAVVVGFTVGAGFQVIETMGYSTYYGFLSPSYINNGIIDYSTMWDRFIYSFSSHALWGAIEAFAIVACKKENYMSALDNKRFWIWISFPIMGHFLWDLIAFSSISAVLMFILFMAIQILFAFLFVLIINIVIHSNLKDPPLIYEYVDEGGEF